ncbi:MAG: hypothetical protein JJV89_03430, partial [Desulfosarcina sp.]|nr:hypothetical protein [Desulfobacterales bacterium]
TNNASDIKWGEESKVAESALPEVTGEVKSKYGSGKGNIDINSLPISETNVEVKAVTESGEVVKYSEIAENALNDVEDQIERCLELKSCLT